MGNHARTGQPKGSFTMKEKLQSFKTAAKQINTATWGLLRSGYIITVGLAIVTYILFKQAVESDRYFEMIAEARGLLGIIPGFIALFLLCALIMEILFKQQER